LSSSVTRPALPEEARLGVLELGRLCGRRRSSARACRAELIEVVHASMRVNEAGM
jgi:hypothetical protein